MRGDGARDRILIGAARRAWQSCESRVRGDCSRRARATCYTGTVQGASPLNSLAEECKLRISYRTLPDADRWRYHREIGRRLAVLDTHDMRARKSGEDRGRSRDGCARRKFAARHHSRSCAIRRDRREEQWRRALALTADVTGSNIVTLICGPGDLDQGASADEYVRANCSRGPAMLQKVSRQNVWVKRATLTIAVGGAPLFQEEGGSCDETIQLRGISCRRVLL